VEDTQAYLIEYAALFEGNFFTYVQTLFLQGLEFLTEIQDIQE